MKTPYYENTGYTEQTKGNLPHWVQDSKIYFVTFRMGDSLPPHVLQEYEDYCAYQQQVIESNGGLPEDWTQFEIEKHNRILRYLDAGYGSCVLKNPEVRKVVEQSLSYINGRQCTIHDYVIMPNHVHLLVEVKGNNHVTELIGNVKKYTARVINAMLNRSGKFWQHEIHDRIVRNERHYWYSARYIAYNPKNCLPDSYSLYLQPEHESSFQVYSNVSL